MWHVTGNFLTAENYLNDSVTWTYLGII